MPSPSVILSSRCQAKNFPSFIHFSIFKDSFLISEGQFVRTRKFLFHPARLMRHWLRFFLSYSNVQGFLIGRIGKLHCSRLSNHVSVFLPVSGCIGKLIPLAVNGIKGYYFPFHLLFDLHRKKEFRRYVDLSWLRCRKSRVGLHEKQS